MLVLNLKRLLELRNVTFGTRYLMNHGFTEGEARSLMSGEVKTMRFTLMQRLCETFQCTPNDLFDWQGDGGHVLSELSKTVAPRIQQLLEGKSPQELEEILRRLSE